jgi:hypothetical protein
MKYTKSSRRTLRVPVSLIGQVFLAISVAQARNDAPPSSDKAWLPPKLSDYENQLAGQRFHEAKISKGFLSDLENGRRNVGADTLLELATALGLSLDYLMTGDIVENQPRAVEIPTALAELAAKEGLTFLQTRQLLGMAQQIVAHRSNTAPDTSGVFDWPKFYASVKKFLT